ncbi:DUF4123 domain-containing protein [uncultured Shewanella sp.]|uniref:DUF4123 domain-containing protein n=1 Tax=uncultured Shewanella sp. TaxID=173975 RepID=UPI00261EC730|nr:DUF4123 domain-containing protein [uncultured Shewanella sp.]
MTPVDFNTIGFHSNEKCWAVIDAANNYLPWLYQNDPAPNYEYLFDDTELIEAMQVGPIVLALKNDADLLWLNEKAQSDDKMSLMIISSSLTTEQVLAKLREYVIVTFGENKKGIFRYFDKRVASYFFQNETLTHLFPGFSALYWYGNTYVQQQKEGHRWWGVFHQHEDASVLSSNDSVLNKSVLESDQSVRLNQVQMQRLNQMQQEKQQVLQQVTAPESLIPSVFSQ